MKTQNSLTRLDDTRDVAAILDSYREDDRAEGDALVMANAMIQAATAYSKAIRARKFDEAHGIASRLRTYADKSKNLANICSVRSH